MIIIADVFFSLILTLYTKIFRMAFIFYILIFAPVYWIAYYFFVKIRWFIQGLFDLLEEFLFVGTINFKESFLDYYFCLV